MSDRQARTYDARSFGRHGVPSHVVPARALTAIDELKRASGALPTQLGLLDLGQVGEGPVPDRWTV